MDPSIDQDHILEPDLEASLDRLVDAAGREAAHFEARAEWTETLGCSWDEGSFRGFSHSRLAGVCLRVWVDGAAGFASCHDPSPHALQSTVEDALRIARTNAGKEAPGFPYSPQGSGKAAYEPEVEADPFESDPAEISGLLERVETAITDVDRDAYARVRFGSTSRRVLFEDAQGRRVSTRFLLSTLQAGAVHRGGSRPGGAVASLAGERGLTDFEVDGGPEALGRKAAHQAEEASRAKAAPAGRQRVLCDPVLSGLLAHESFGHLTEYDLVAMEWSRLAGRLGQRFADEAVSVVDAPVPPGDTRDGVRLPIDEEGTEGREVRVLDDGVLRNWMHARGSAPVSDQAPTGNARALNVRFPPIVRMRNTYVEAGDHSLEEMLEGLGDGVYLLNARGGAPASDGSFMFTAERGYRVEDGEIQHPLRSTSISGNILDFLEGVEALGRELEFSTSNFGGCGKWGQSYLPVGTGGPHVLVDQALVGGKA